MKELEKTYNPGESEETIYQKWESSGFFNPDKLEEAGDRFWKAEAFSIMMPPPNATGELHVGHAMMLALEDLMTRFARMSGKKTLWLPGTDHAAIATQNVVERKLWEQEKKTRHDVGREELLGRIDGFVGQTRGRIQQQIRKLGSSCDWSRERYTLSPELSLAVRTAFKKMYDAGLIYRGERLVNGCPRCATTLADDEVEYRETDGRLYHIRYPLRSGKGQMIVATTRPETMLGDTAVAVHPDDPRYKKLVGQSVMLPLLNRELKVIADKQVDQKFGTGILKVTPGHDPNDFEIGKRHNLEIINIFSLDGKISDTEAVDHGFEDYAGLTTDEARKKIAAALQEQGFLEKTEDIKHNVGYCYRCGTVVEPIVSKQWFVNVNQKVEIKNKNFQKLLKLGPQATLKELSSQAVKSGAIKIIPERFTKNYLQWTENLRDWNISRQIWFGHRIPVWYCQDCSETAVAIDEVKTCPNCGSSALQQDPDTLDTWFSSSLWTFSTLGWPRATADLQTYHPTTVLETGYDILTFWVARMILMTGFVLEDIPFRSVYLHGLVRDIAGKKMSKSKGNALNPLAMIEKYGTDALRLSLILGTTPGKDTKISEDKIQSYRNFINKLWNIARFVLGQIKDSRLEIKGLESKILDLKSPTLADSWILQELDGLKANLKKHIKNHQYSLAGENLTEFTWGKFADWYLEINKIEGGKDEILIYTFSELLKLWHPFIPFVTEHLWSQLSSDLLMMQEYPMPPASKTRDTKPAAKFQALQSLITGIRNLRSEYRQPPAEHFACYLELPEKASFLQDQAAIVENLARVKLNLAAVPPDKTMPYFLWEGAKVYLIIPGFDPKKELELAQKELKTAQTHAKKLEAQLGKKAFLEKAPPEVVEKLKADAAAATERKSQLEAKISSLK